jgi:hypothetical protein
LPGGFLRARWNAGRSNWSKNSSASNHDLICLRNPFTGLDHFL